MPDRHDIRSGSTDQGRASEKDPGSYVIAAQAIRAGNPTATSQEMSRVAGPLVMLAA
jgi:hypothetical protein